MLWGEYNYDEDIAAQRKKPSTMVFLRGFNKKLLKQRKIFFQWDYKSNKSRKEQAYPLRLSNNLQRIFHNNVKNCTKQVSIKTIKKKGFSILGKSLFLFLFTRSGMDAR